MAVATNTAVIIVKVVEKTVIITNILKMQDKNPKKAIAECLIEPIF
jgi:hypothetical protein